METKIEDGGKVIGNVATLDLRTASEAAVANIKRVGNVATVLVSPETAGLVTKLNIGNVACVVEAPLDLKVHEGEVIVSWETFKGLKEPLNMMVIGRLIIHPDVPQAEAEAGFGELYVIGQVLCPDNLSGVVHAKLAHLTGKVQVYASGAQIVTGRLELDNGYLMGLDDGSDVCVVGKLTASQVLSNELLAAKLKSIQVFGKVTCREENEATLLPLLDSSSGSYRVTVIPTGFELVKRSLVLDAGMLAHLPGSKLYCLDDLRIAQDVDSASLENNLESLVVNGSLICPAGLRNVVAGKINLLETQAIFYEGELWLVEDELTLKAPRFNYLDGKATLIVYGELTVARDVDPKLLADRLHKVHNYGEIRCTIDQMAAIEARLGVTKGVLVDIDGVTEEGEGIGNVAYLKL